MIDTQRDNCLYPLFAFSNRKSVAIKLLLTFCFGLFSNGCAVNSVNINSASRVNNYTELKKLINGIDCNTYGELLECVFHFDSFNIFKITKTSQYFKFFIDSEEIIIKRELTEAIIEYHIIPQTELPDEFTEFK